MILADKIINERKKNGWSQEDLAEMLDVSRQSVSKWEGAQSVPDLQKILKMAEIFGVSTDYLLKDEMEPENTPSVSYEGNTSEISSKRKVSLEDATEFISAKMKIMPKIAIGVFLCITCPVMLILLAGLSHGGVIPLSEKAVTAIGLSVLFAHIGIAVFIFVTKHGKLSKFDYLEQEEFETEYGVDGMVKERMSNDEKKYTTALTAGVLMCVLGAFPIVITSILEAPDYVITSMVCLLLLLVGIAVYLFVSVCGVYNSYKVLLQIEGFTPTEKRNNKKTELVTRIYWLTITFVFLGVSFTTGRWDMTWIIWAVSGVLFALVRVISVAAIKD